MILENIRLSHKIMMAMCLSLYVVFGCRGASSSNEISSTNSQDGNANLNALLARVKLGVRDKEYGDVQIAASQLLLDASKNPDGWNYGNAIHVGNIALGLVNLKNGDIKKANEFLLLASDTPGSPQLSSFGPDMLLARELLKSGGADVVVEYLTKCKSFWKSDKGKLELWKNDIKMGREPDFGANVGFWM